MDVARCPATHYNYVMVIGFDKMPLSAGEETSGSSSTAVNQ